MKREKKQDRAGILGGAIRLFVALGLCFAGETAASPGSAVARDLPTPSISLPAGLGQTRWEDTWLAASPALLGFNGERLEASVNEIGEMDGIYSFILLRGGYLIVEQYFREGYRTKPHNIKSASKSVISALIGIARDEGLLRLDLPILDILPGLSKPLDSRKAEITIEHLLTMTAGLKPTSYQAYNSWVLKGDWVKAALDQPLVADPGTHYQYSTGNTHLLSAVLTAVTGRSTREYVLQKLFDPMNITMHGWDTDPKGIYQGGNNLQLVPRDMARIGQLYLNGGNYRGRQLVSRQWIDESTRAQSIGKNDVYGRYGYLWYSHPGGQDAFVAVGFGGQYIYVSRQYDCVIVVTATLESKGREWEHRLFDLLHGKVFRSIQSDAVLPFVLSGAGGSFPSAGSTVADTDRPDQKTDLPPLYPISQTIRNVNLRQKPSQQSPRLDLVPAGTQVNILKTEGPWHQVEFNHRKGWLFRPYVDTFISEKPHSFAEASRLIASDGKRPIISAKVASADTAEPMSSEIGWADVRLNLRAGPSKSDRVLRVLKVGVPLEIRRKSGSWLQVRAERFDGWVFADYVRIQPKKIRMVAVSSKTPPADSTGKTELSETIPSEKKGVTDGSILPSTESTKDLADLVAQLQARLRIAETSEEEQGLALKQLQERQEAMAAESAALKKDRAFLRAELLSTQDALKRQRQTVLDGEKSRKVQATEMLGLQTQVAALTKALEEGQRVQGRQKDELAELTRAFKRRDAVASGAETEIAQLNSVRSALQKRQATLEAVLDDHRLARIKSEKENSRLATNLDKAQAQMAALSETVRAMKDDRDGLETRLAVRDKGMQSQRETISQLESGNTRLTAELDVLKKQHGKQQEGIREADASRSELQKRQATLEAVLDDHRQARIKSEEENSRLASDLDKAQAQMAALSETVRAMKDDRDGLETRLAVRDKGMQSQRETISQLESGNTRLTAELDVLKKQHGKQQEGIREADASRSELQKRQATLEAVLDDHRQARIKSEEENSRLASDLDKAQAQMAALSETVQAMKDDRDGLETRLAVRDKGLQPLRETIAQLESGNTKLATELDSLKKQYGKQQEEIREADALRSELQKRQATLEAVLDDHRQARIKSEAEKSRLASDLDKTRTQMTALGETVKAMKDDRDGLETRLAARNEALQSQREAIAQLESGNTYLIVELDSLKKQYGKQQEEIMASRTLREEQDRQREIDRKQILELQKRQAQAPGDQKTMAVEIAKATPKAEAVPDPPPQPSPDFDSLDDFVRSWADAWQGKLTEKYLAHYSKDFQPKGGIARAAWARQRQKRLSKPAFIEIELRNIQKKEIRPSQATITFDQRYQSSTYADETAKTLDLRWEEDGWRIVKETSH